jgi:hypothetical protein
MGDSLISLSKEAEKDGKDEKDKRDAWDCNEVAPMALYSNQDPQD